MWDVTVLIPDLGFIVTLLCCESYLSLVGAHVF